MDQGHQESDILDELIRSFKFTREEAKLTLDTVKDDNVNIYEPFGVLTTIKEMYQK